MAAVAALAKFGRTRLRHTLARRVPGGFFTESPCFAILAASLDVSLNPDTTAFQIDHPDFHGAARIVG